LFAELDDDEPPAALPPMSPLEQVFADYRASGFSLKNHPMAFFRHELDQQRILRASELKTVDDGRRVRVAGIVILRQRPGTARGITFVTLEDETGVVNLVVRPQIWDRYYSVARGKPAWIAHGILESRESVIHLVVNRLDELSAKIGTPIVRSRDFR
jgi:error-prone DNA polymerase